MTVLDPMVGSGTTIAAAQEYGHHALGFDMDPLAVLMSKVRCAPADYAAIERTGKRVVEKAMRIAEEVPLRKAIPRGAEDEESQEFIRYWFDRRNRKQLYALSEAIHGVRTKRVRDVLWCAFSRTIIRKQGGASLAMDVSHSRPHKVSERSEQQAFLLFKDSLVALLGVLKTRPGISNARPIIGIGDARRLPLASSTVDLIITSPPYLNAIDYLRGHRLSLIWMGYSMADLRTVRSNSIGSERAADAPPSEELELLTKDICSRRKFSRRLRNTLLRYLIDLDQSVAEMARVLVHGGSAIVVIGNSSNQGVFIKNSLAVERLSLKHGLQLLERRTRRIPNNRRYLPTPAKGKGPLAQRMRTEVVLVLRKTN